MDKKGDSQPTIERWTARRKAELVLEIIRGQKTIVDAEGNGGYPCFESLQSPADLRLQ